MRTRISIAIVAALLGGCITIQNAKTLEIPPSDSPVAVTSTARAQCIELVLFFYCRLNLRIDSSSGQHVSDFPE